MGTGGARNAETPVLIVGGGPVGLGLALDLGTRGIACTLVERSDGAIKAPKASAVNVRTMEFCRRWGIADEVRKAGLPPDFPHTALYLTSLTGHEIARVERPSHGGSRASLYSPESAQRCNQLWFDPILRRAADDFDCVTLRHQCRFDSFARNGSGIVATVTDLATGAEERIGARYLIDCSGTHSAIRRALGIEMGGLLPDSYAVSIFYRSPALWAAFDKGEAALYYFIGTEGIWATLTPFDRGTLWRALCDVPAEESTFPAAEIERYLHRMAGVDFEHEMISVTPWVRRERVADSYGGDGVFLAGDAAHQNGPEGGYGMNTGMGDAVDLGWKLAARLDGWGGPRLEASYEAERRPVALRNVGEATRNKTDQVFDATPAVLDESAEGARVRGAIGARILADANRRHQHHGIALGYRYAPSPVCCADGGEAPADDTSRYVPSSWPGARAPHGWLADGRSTVDLFGRGFVLLRLGAGAADATPIERAARRRGVPLQIVTVEEPEIRALYERDLVLVRPDGHVCWRGDALPPDPLDVIDRVRGA